MYDTTKIDSKRIYNDLKRIQRELEEIRMELEMIQGLPKISTNEYIRLNPFPDDFEKFPNKLK